MNFTNIRIYDNIKLHNQQEKEYKYEEIKDINSRVR